MGDKRVEVGMKLRPHLRMSHTVPIVRYCSQMLCRSLVSSYSSLGTPLTRLTSFVTPRRDKKAIKKGSFYFQNELFLKAAPLFSSASTVSANFPTFFDSSSRRLL